MPIYSYSNEITGEFVEQKFPIGTAPESVEIEGKRFFRDRASDMAANQNGFIMRSDSSSGTTTGRGAWPMKSDGAGCHPGQIPDMEAHAKSRGVTTQYDQSTGQAIFRDRTHRSKHLKAFDLHDNDAGYSD